MYRELYQTAMEALKNAYAPYSNYKVGAALLTESGKVYTGVNVENSSFGATICAERVAFCKAISEGERDFKVIAICSSEGEAWPCGICRQFMYDFNEDLIVVTGEDEDHMEIQELSELLPKGFKL